MSRFAYVDGAFIPHRDAAVHIEDRGYQFADAIYEVWTVTGGRLRDESAHFDRLDRSLHEMRIANPKPRSAWKIAIAELLRRNRVREGLVYLQVSRGVARRDHVFPNPAPRPTVVLTAKRLDFSAAQARAEKGVAIVTTPDIRWGRCDIKTVGLLANVLAKQAAKEAGAAEAWQYDSDGFVTEGCSCNAWILTDDDRLITRQADHAILNGVTRRAVIACAEARQIRVEERPFTLDEARQAKEAFITSASTWVTPVIAIDGEPVGAGRPGPLARALREDYAALPAGV